MEQPNLRISVLLSANGWRHLADDREKNGCIYQSEGYKYKNEIGLGRWVGRVVEQASAFACGRLQLQQVKELWLSVGYDRSELSTSSEDYGETE